MGARQPDEDFAREVESHVQLEADRLVEEGLAPEPARLEAQKRFGNAALARERTTTRGARCRFDIHAGAGRLARHQAYPIACVIAVISLGGGIGATTITW